MANTDDLISGILILYIALRKVKIVYIFGLSECNRVKGTRYQIVMLPEHFRKNFS